MHRSLVHDAASIPLAERATAINNPPQNGESSDSRGSTSRNAAQTFKCIGRHLQREVFQNLDHSVARGFPHYVVDIRVWEGSGRAERGQERVPIPGVAEHDLQQRRRQRPAR